MSEDDFDFRSASGVEIDRLSVRTVDGTLVFDESPDLPDADRRALRLHVCVDVFDLADATLETQLGLTTWGDAGLDWSALRTVSVALSEMSYDATLSGLEVADAAGNAIELDDDFAPDMVAYTAMVANAIVRITVTPADRTRATRRYKDGGRLAHGRRPGRRRLPDSRRQRRAGGGDGVGGRRLTYTAVARVDLGTIPADWSLKPDAVGAGETFRLMFVSTTKRNGTTDIADYNTHVRRGIGPTAPTSPRAPPPSTPATTRRRGPRTPTRRSTGSTRAEPGAVADNYADDGTWGTPRCATRASSTTLIASTPVTGTLGRDKRPVGQWLYQRLVFVVGHIGAGLHESR